MSLMNFQEKKATVTVEDPHHEEEEIDSDSESEDTIEIFTDAASHTGQSGHQSHLLEQSKTKLTPTQTRLLALVET